MVITPVKINFLNFSLENLQKNFLLENFSSIFFLNSLKRQKIDKVELHANQILKFHEFFITSLCDSDKIKFIFFVSPSNVHEHIKKISRRVFRVKEKIDENKAGDIQC